MNNRIFRNWSLIRAVRLLIGLGLLYQAVLSGSFMLIGLALVLCILPIINAGCSTGTCVPNKKPITKKEELL
tara:strand:+ start:204 stop:419 length:216 start_codon:yes stop_codon:yes gene_type:complete